MNVKVSWNIFGVFQFRLVSSLSQIMNQQMPEDSFVIGEYAGYQTLVTYCVQRPAVYSLYSATPKQQQFAGGKMAGGGKMRNRGMRNIDAEWE